MIYFRRIALFCLGYHLSKHKMTVYANLVVAWLPASPATPMNQAEMSKLHPCNKGTQNPTFAIDVFVNGGTKQDGIGMVWFNRAFF